MLALLAMGRINLAKGAGHSRFRKLPHDEEASPSFHPHRIAGGDRYSSPHYPKGAREAAAEKPHRWHHKC